MWGQRMATGGVDLSPGVSGNIADTLIFSPARQAPEPPSQVGGSSSPIGGTAPHLTVVGGLGLLVAIWLFQRAGHLSGNVVYLSLINFFIIGLTAGTGILLAKVLFSKVQIPNVSEAVLAI